MPPYNPVFKGSKGIYVKTTLTKQGNESVQCDYGNFKGNNIEIYSLKENDTLKNKFYYVSNKALKCIRSKLVYFQNNRRIRVALKTADKISQ